MARYVVAFDNSTSGSSADTYLTVASFIVPDTAGVRARLVELCVGPADDAPQDLNMSMAVKRIADVSAGAAGTTTAISAANVAKCDPDGPVSPCAAARNYTAEPTTYETEPLFCQGFNLRGGFFKQFDEQSSPAAKADQLLGILIAPRTAAAKLVSGYAVFEVY